MPPPQQQRTSPVTPIGRPRPDLKVNTTQTLGSLGPSPPRRIYNPDRLPVAHLQLFTSLHSPPILSLDYINFPPESPVSDLDEESFLATTPVTDTPARPRPPVAPVTPANATQPEELSQELWTRRNRQRESVGSVGRSLVNPETNQGVSMNQARMPSRTQISRAKWVQEFEVFQDSDCQPARSPSTPRVEEESSYYGENWEYQEAPTMVDSPTDGEHHNWELESATSSGDDMEIDPEAEFDWEGDSIVCESDEDVVNEHSIIVDGHLRHHHVPRDPPRAPSPPRIAHLINSSDVIEAGPLKSDDRRFQTRTHDLQTLRRLLNSLDIDFDPTTLLTNFPSPRLRFFRHHPGRNPDIDDLIRPDAVIPVLELLADPSPSTSLGRQPNFNFTPDDPEKYIDPPDPQETNWNHRPGPYRAVIPGMVSSTWAVYGKLDKMRGAYPVDPITYAPLPIPPSKPRNLNPNGVNPYDEEDSTDYDSGEDYCGGKADGPGPWKLGADATRRREKQRRWPGHKNKDFWFPKSEVADYIHPAAADIVLDNWIAGQGEAGDEWEDEEVVEIGPKGILRRSTEKKKACRERNFGYNAPRKRNRSEPHGNPPKHIEVLCGGDYKNDEWGADIDDTFENIKLKRSIKPTPRHLETMDIDDNEKDVTFSPLAPAGCDCGIKTPPTTVDKEHAASGMTGEGRKIAVDSPVPPKITSTVRRRVRFNENPPPRPPSPSQQQQKQDEEMEAQREPRIFEAGWYHPWMERGAYPGSKALMRTQKAEEMRKIEERRQEAVRKYGKPPLGKKVKDEKEEECTSSFKSKLMCNPTPDTPAMASKPAAEYSNEKQKLILPNGEQPIDHTPFPTPTNSLMDSIKRKSSQHLEEELPDAPLFSSTPAVAGYPSKKPKLNPQVLPSAKFKKPVENFKNTVLPADFKKHATMVPAKAPAAVLTKAPTFKKPEAFQTPSRPITCPQTGSTLKKKMSSTPTPTLVRVLPTIRSIRATPKVASRRLTVKNTPAKKPAAGGGKVIWGKVDPKMVSVGGGSKPASSVEFIASMDRTKIATTTSVARARRKRAPTTAEPIAIASSEDVKVDTHKVVRLDAKRRKGNDGKSLSTAVEHGAAVEANVTNPGDEQKQIKVKGGDEQKQIKIKGDKAQEAYKKQDKPASKPTTAIVGKPVIKPAAITSSATTTKPDPATKSIPASKPTPTAAKRKANTTTTSTSSAAITRIRTPPTTPIPTTEEEEYEKRAADTRRRKSNLGVPVPVAVDEPGAANDSGASLEQQQQQQQVKKEGPREQKGKEVPGYMRPTRAAKAKAMEKVGGSKGNEGADGKRYGKGIMPR